MIEFGHTAVGVGVRDQTAELVVALFDGATEDWRTDALAIMAQETQDPRGWVTLDWDSESDPAEAEQRPRSFPFTLSPESALGEGLHEISLDSAAPLIVALTDEWFEVKNIPDFVNRKEQLLADARILLARFGRDAICYTTAGNARTTRDPDFFQPIRGGVGITEHLMDLGLLVVSASEVGVFWRFNAY
ncbi:hypothetical protein ACFRKB_02745 [Streptomyces scopuliridis]|uniref:hypothetical protein n=1 Tax=Streptomyces scopuliridis TaxID=452529 RepID=UPI0036C74444